MEYSNASKALRWLANQFPAIENPKDDADKLSTCINLYCTNGAETIIELLPRIEEAEARTKHVELERDMAIEDVLDAAITPCSYCKYAPSNGGACDMKTENHDMFSCWVWRGV